MVSDTSHRSVGFGLYEVDISDGPTVVEFTVVERVEKPRLPVLTTGSLEAFNYNGCATDARSYELTVDMSNDGDVADTDSLPLQWSNLVKLPGCFLSQVKVQRLDTGDEYRSLADQ